MNRVCGKRLLGKTGSLAFSLLLWWISALSTGQKDIREDQHQGGLVSHRTSVRKDQHLLGVKWDLDHLKNSSLFIWIHLEMPCVWYSPRKVALAIHPLGPEKRCTQGSSYWRNIYSLAILEPKLYPRTPDDSMETILASQGFTAKFLSERGWS